MDIFGFLATPLGWILWFIYKYIGNYFISIFLFTLLIRLLTFPLALKSQKSQADRARLAPRLERLQKKYAQDKQKLQQKQMDLYEKEGVSMTGGCLPMVINMIVLFGVIAVIYSPLTHLARIPQNVITASVEAVTQKEGETLENKVNPKELTGYYRELRMLKAMEDNRADVLAAIDAKMTDAQRAENTAQDYYDQMMHIRKDFTIFGYTLLDNPFTGWTNINILWLIPLLSGLTALVSSMVSMHYTKMLTAQGEQVPGQGCSNTMMLVMMPLFSLFITFTVPGGVGIYWICSNIIMVFQTIVLNQIYNPAKIRMQAEKEYEERRRKKAEDKKRLAEARMREEEAARQAAKEEAEAKEQARLEAAAGNKKPVKASQNPNKIKRREEKAAEAAEASEEAATSAETVSATEDAAVPAEENADEQG